MIHSNPFTTMSRLFRLLCLLGLLSNASLLQALQEKEDPLPSWNPGPLKQSIFTFVQQVTIQDTPHYVPPSERIAVFDNDGTLWPEKPLIQGLFTLARLKELAQADPSLKTRQPFQAALNGDLEGLQKQGQKAILELITTTHGNMTQAEFNQAVQDFFKKGIHPKLGVSLTQIAYQPMIELMDYLREKDFQIWICSGGGIDFVRAISQQMYGVPPQQVIGSQMKKEIRQKDNQLILYRLPELSSFNDKQTKPIHIDSHIGKRPIFAAGNVRSGGDIAMLTYSSQNQYPTFQLLINHDDPKREFAYKENNNTSLKAAQQAGWKTVSIQKDWNRIFSHSNPQNTNLPPKKKP